MHINILNIIFVKSREMWVVSSRFNTNTLAWSYINVKLDSYLYSRKLENYLFEYVICIYVLQT